MTSLWHFGSLLNKFWPITTVYRADSQISLIHSISSLDIIKIDHEPIHAVTTIHLIQHPDRTCPDPSISEIVFRYSLFVAGDYRIDSIQFSSAGAY
jgi:hypothetical protein